MSSLFEMGMQLVDDKSISEVETTDLAHEAPIAKLVDTIITKLSQIKLLIFILNQKKKPLR